MFELFDLCTGIFLTILLVILLLIVLVLRKRIQIAIAMIKEASKYVATSFSYFQ